MARDKQEKQADLLQGTLNLLILKAASLGRMHGYGLLLRIEQISDQALSIDQGAIYPALIRLERQRFLHARWGVSQNNRRAKFYVLTTTGQERLRQEMEGWNRLVTAMWAVLSAEPPENILSGFPVEAESNGKCDWPNPEREDALPSPFPNTLSVKTAIRLEPARSPAGTDQSTRKTNRG